MLAQSELTDRKSIYNFTDLFFQCGKSVYNRYIQSYFDFSNIVVKIAKKEILRFLIIIYSKKN